VSESVLGAENPKELFDWEKEAAPAPRKVSLK